MDPGQILLIIFAVVGFAVAGLGGLTAAAIFIAVQHLPNIPPPSPTGQNTLSWSLALSALMVWVFGAVTRPQ